MYFTLCEPVGCSSRLSVLIGYIDPCASVSYMRPSAAGAVIKLTCEQIEDMELMRDIDEIERGRAGS